MLLDSYTVTGLSFKNIMTHSLPFRAQDEKSMAEAAKHKLFPKYTNTFITNGTGA